jgi:hypothetical protein
MTQRSIIVLAAMLAVLVLIILVAQRGEQPPGAELGSLVPGLQENLDAVTAVTITGAGGTVVASIERGVSGWTVAQRDGFPADVSRLRNVLTALAEARRIERKTANPQFYERLGVRPIEDAQANGTLVSIAGLDEPIAIIVGDAAGTDYRYVRLQNDEVSWLIDRDPEVADDTGEWLAAELLDIAGDRIQSVTINHPNGEVVQVSRSSRDQTNLAVADIPAGRELLYDGVANVIGDVLEKLTLEDVESATAEPGATPVRSVFKTFDGLVITANGFERDDSAWVSFSAAFDAEQAAAFAPDEAEADTAAGEVESDAAAAGGAESDGGDADVASEAARLNERLAGWHYKITQFKFDQMTRNMDDLLQTPPAEDS